jgi:hypothetical protein
MTINFCQMGATTVKALTSSDGSFADPAMPNNPNGAWRGQYILSSDQPFHVNVNAPAVANANARIPANTLVEIELVDSDVLHFILGAGGSASSIWITKKA